MILLKTKNGIYGERRKNSSWTMVRCFSFVKRTANQRDGSITQTSKRKDVKTLKKACKWKNLLSEEETKLKVTIV